MTLSTESLKQEIHKESKNDAWCLIILGTNWKINVQNVLKVWQWESDLHCILHAPDICYKHIVCNHTSGYFQLLDK